MDRPVQDLAKCRHFEAAAVARPLSIRPRWKSPKLHQLQHLWPTAHSHSSPVAPGVFRELCKFDHAGRAVYSAAKKALSRSAYSWTMKVPVLKDLTEVIDSHRRATIIRVGLWSSISAATVTTYDAGEINLRFETVSELGS